VESAVLVAVTTKSTGTGTDAGAVNVPSGEMVPVIPVHVDRQATFQLTAVLVVFKTVAAK
jgi:hypothetical protein